MIKCAGRSLTARLLITMAILQIAVPILGMVVWMVFSPYVTWGDVAAASAQKRILEALERDPASGIVSIRDTPALTAYAATRPDFRYAVLQNGRVAKGSDPELRALFERMSPYIPKNGQLEIAMPYGRGTAQLESGRMTDDAELVFATVGNQFQLEDLDSYVRVFLPELIPLLAPTFLAAAIALPLLIQAAVRPLRRAARDAEGVTFANLGRRLSEEGVPEEAAPLVRAVNAALARLEVGARNQRLFYANAAHELRTPVAILQARLDATPGIPRGDDLRRDVARIITLIDQLLVLERANAPLTENEEINLFERARLVVGDRAPLAIHSGRSVDFVAEGPSPVIRGDRRVLDSALANLIDNALRAEPVGGCIHVRAGPGLMIAVIDHGPGIPIADRDLVFEPFWRKENDTTGSGLGLSIVREALRILGGQIAIEDTIGGGASFRITFSD